MFGQKKRNKVILYKKIFSSPDGEKVLQDLAKTFFVFNSVMSNDPYETAYNEGARSVVLRILKTINMTEKQLDALSKLSLEEDNEI